MSIWMPLRKTCSGISLSYGQTFSNNLGATNFRIRTEPEFELSFDLDGNLHKRSKQSNCYSDASELADGLIQELTLIQIAEDQVIRRLDEIIRRLDQPPKIWTLIINLRGSHAFRVKPVLSHTCLSLHVVKGKNTEIQSKI